MLQNTFCHIPGISRSRELQLWRNNILHWNDLKDNHIVLPFSRRHQLLTVIEDSIAAHENNDYQFFVNRIQGRDHWRVYDELKNQCCFLDIETTGLSKHHDDVTVIGIYDGKASKILVKGKNLHLFPNEIKKYPLLVTFNGRCFDVPFLKAKFPQVDFNKFHIDLRFALKDIGYTGGLKRIEKEIGIQRDDDLQEVDGWEAVRLWYRYLKGDEQALDTLIRYNKADIENLQFLMDFAFERLKRKHFLSAMR